jgi:biopolymer transport protein ExbB
MIGLRRGGLAAALLLAAGAVLAQSGGSPAIEAAAAANAANRASQQKIDQLDDATRAALEKYRSAIWQTQQLNVYAQQVEPLLATQEAERAQLQVQMKDFDTGSRDLTPLLLRMLDSLDRFVALDLPFLQAERRDRVAKLRQLMTDPATPQAEKYRRIVEAYRIEGDYGRSFGAERIDIGDGQTRKTVDVLRVGRVVLLSLTLDGHEASLWNAAGKRWEPLPGRYRSAIREALKIARESAAPIVVTLPIPAAPAAAAPPPKRADDGAGLMRVADVLSLLVPVAKAATPAAAPQGLDELLRQIKDGAAQNARINADREARFLKDRNTQQAAQAQADAELHTAEAKAAAVRGRYEANQKAIADLKTQLTAQTGDAGQVYAAVREAAAQFRGNAAESFVSAQFPERLKTLDALADPNRLPSPRQLEDFWYLLQQEMTENGKVTRFNASVTAEDGTRGTVQVVRIGAFAAIANGRYLIVQADGTLGEPAKQTQSTGTAADFAEAASGFAAVAIDPTRGNLLRLASLRPTIVERINQGGVIGYIIITVGLIGFVLAIYQLVYLLRVGQLIDAQLRRVDQPSPLNPLGRVLACLDHDTASTDPEILETRVSEAVLRETPKLERFQAFLRMVVAAGPLLGLVGTVTGMIITFQVITEVGAGDPKIMAGGISVAMIATVLGLVIAIPLLFINSILSARSRVLVQILDEQSAGLLARALEARAAR